MEVHYQQTKFHYRMRKGLSLSKPAGFIFLPPNLLLIHRNILYSITVGFKVQNRTISKGHDHPREPGPGLYVSKVEINGVFKIQQFEYETIITGKVFYNGNCPPIR